MVAAPPARRSCVEALEASQAGSTGGDSCHAAKVVTDLHESEERRKAAIEELGDAELALQTARDTLATAVDEAKEESRCMLEWKQAEADAQRKARGDDLRRKRNGLDGGRSHSRAATTEEATRKRSEATEVDAAQSAEQAQAERERLSSCTEQGRGLPEAVDADANTVAGKLAGGAAETGHLQDVFAEPTGRAALSKPEGVVGGQRRRHPRAHPRHLGTRSHDRRARRRRRRAPEEWERLGCLARRRRRAQLTVRRWCPGDACHGQPCGRAKAPERRRPDASRAHLQGDRRTLERSVPLRGLQPCACCPPPAVALPNERSLSALAPHGSADVHHASRRARAGTWPASKVVAATRTHEDEDEDTVKRERVQSGATSLEARRCTDGTSDEFDEDDAAAWDTCCHQALPKISSRVVEHLTKDVHHEKMATHAQRGQLVRARLAPAPVHACHACRRGQHAARAPPTAAAATSSRGNFFQSSFAFRPAARRRSSMLGCLGAPCRCSENAETTCRGSVRGCMREPPPPT